LSQMRMNRWVGAINYNCHSKRTKKPEQLFPLPEDQGSIEKKPAANKKELDLAIKKAKRLQSWDHQ